MKPFSKNVWYCLGAAYFTVSTFFFILGRLSPGEWDNPYPCIFFSFIIINLILNKYFDEILFNVIGIEGTFTRTVQK